MAALPRRRPVARIRDALYVQYVCGTPRAVALGATMIAFGRRMGGSAPETFRSYLLSLGFKSYRDTRKAPLEAAADPCEDGDAAEFWERVSAAGEAMLDADGANTPTYDADDGAGFPRLVCAGSDLMLGQGDDDLEAGGTEYTIVAVFSPDAESAVCGWYDPAGLSRVQIGIHSNGVLKFEYTDSAGAYDLAHESGDKRGTGRHLVFAGVDGSGNPFFVLNGGGPHQGIPTGGSYTLTKMFIGGACGFQVVGRLERTITAPERSAAVALCQLTDARGWGTP